MPIHTPGPRLLSSIPFRFLGGASGTGGRRNTNVMLNITAMVDMMVMLTVFLLATFSATGELIMQQKGLELPTALNDKELERAPIIIISRDSVTFGQDEVANTRALVQDESAEWKIPELFDMLQLEKFNFEKRDMSDDLRRKLRGLVVLQADKDVDAKVLNRVMKTAYAAEYTEVMFAVTRKAKK